MSASTGSLVGGVLLELTTLEDDFGNGELGVTTFSQEEVEAPIADKDVLVFSFAF